MSRAARRLALALLAAALCTACAEPDDGFAAVEKSLASMLATLSGSSGDLQVKRAGQGLWEPSAIGGTLYPGDWVRTGARAWARVDFLSGGALELDEDAVLVIEAVKPLQKTRPELPDSAPLVAVQAGSIRSTLADAAGNERPLLVRSADGAQTQLARSPEAGPTELRLAEVEGATEVSVALGEVRVAIAGKEEVVASGAAAALGKQGPKRVALLGAPALEAPAAELRVQAGALALRWAPVPEASSYRVQVAGAATFRALALDEELPALEAPFDAGKPGTWWWRVAARDGRGRQSPWSAPRRLYAEREAPSDALTEPEDGASYGFTDGPPRIAFGWKPREGARAYRLVVARSADLLGTPVASEVVEAPPLQLGTLQPGAYFWGVFVQGKELEPLFLSPRRLSVKKVSGGAVVAPQRIRKWGE